MLPEAKSYPGWDVASITVLSPVITRLADKAMFHGPPPGKANLMVSVPGLVLAKSMAA